MFSRRKLKGAVLLLSGLFLAILFSFGCAQRVEKKTDETKETKPSKKEGGDKKVFVLKSSGLKDGKRMPPKYANKGVSGGENLSPPFEWKNIPEDTKSFALAMVDHHPVAKEFVHWLVINIPASVNSIEEGASGAGKVPPGSRELNTDYGVPKYGGPRPPAGTGNHPYETTIYALNVESLELSQNVSLDQFLAALEGKVLAKSSLTSMFSQ